eukprot:605831-Hanusia_phi.AAC.2
MEGKERELDRGEREEEESVRRGGTWLASWELPLPPSPLPLLARSSESDRVNVIPTRSRRHTRPCVWDLRLRCRPGPRRQSNLRQTDTTSAKQALLLLLVVSRLLLLLLLNLLVSNRIQTPPPPHPPRHSPEQPLVHINHSLIRITS